MVTNHNFSKLSTYFYLFIFFNCSGKWRLNSPNSRIPLCTSINIKKFKVFLRNKIRIGTYLNIFLEKSPFRKKKSERIVLPTRKRTVIRCVGTRVFLIFQFYFPFDIRHIFVQARPQLRTLFRTTDLSDKVLLRQIDTGQNKFSPFNLAIFYKKKKKNTYVSRYG